MPWALVMLMRQKLVRYVLFLLGLGFFSFLGLVGGLVWERNRPVTLPAPSGPYPVGRVEYDWTDTARPDPLGADPQQARKLNVWIWYPGQAGESGAGPAPYLPSAWVAAREREAGLGLLLMQNLRRVRGHSIQQLPLSSAQERYPVLILQPGFGPILPDYTSLAESLASDGYIVVGSTPTDSASVVVFKNGQVASRTPRGNLPDNAAPKAMQRAAGRLVKVWAADDRFVLDQVEQLNQADPAGRFTGRIDLNAVGVSGHSLGGASAAEFCSQDTHCKAGADLDGYLYGDVLQTGLKQPFLFVWSEPVNPNDPAWLKARQDAQTVSAAGSREVVISGARHFNFADFSVEFQPVYHLEGGLGSIDGAQGLRTIAEYVREFFDRALR